MLVGEQITDQFAEMSDYERRRDLGHNLILALARAGEGNWVGRTGRRCQDILGLTDDDMRMAWSRADDNPRLHYGAKGFAPIAGAFPATLQESPAIELVDYVQQRETESGVLYQAMAAEMLHHASVETN
jgi:hypothetical protein